MTRQKVRGCMYNIWKRGEGREGKDVMQREDDVAKGREEEERDYGRGVKGKERMGCKGRMT
jgi:hypothetical protein